MVARDDVSDVEQDVLILEATSEIVIRTGRASITLRRNGDVIISGVNIVMEGTASARVEVGGDLELKASGPISINGALVNIN